MESLILAYTPICKESVALVAHANILVIRYKKVGINKDNICKLVSTLMVKVQKLKKVISHDKKDLVIDIIYAVIENIDDGTEDSEFETFLKTMVPIMIDSFSTMLKVNKAYACVPCI
jgi:hypothetical protein